MTIQNLIHILNNIIFLYLYQKTFNLKFSKTQIINIFLITYLISKFINNLLTLPFILPLLILIKLLKYNIYSLLIASTLFLTIHLLTTFLSNILLIPNIFSTIVLLIITIIFTKKNIKIHLLKLPLSSTILLISINLILILQNLNLINIYFMILIYILLISILLIYNIHLIILNYKKENELNNLNLICDSTRAFKHDFDNIMHSIGGYIKTNNITDLKNYYDKLIPECFCINNLHRFHSQLMQNPALYSIISDKYNLAEQNNIKMSLNISTNLNNLRIDDYSLTRILGILLDNSIEASKECTSKIVNISFEENKNKQTIIIENTFKNKNLSLQKLYEKEFTTKKNNSGLGLWEVKKILTNHKNIILETNIKNNFFIQEIEIF